MSILYLNETIQIEQFKLSSVLSVQARLMPSRPILKVGKQEAYLKVLGPSKW